MLDMATVPVVEIIVDGYRVLVLSDRAPGTILTAAETRIGETISVHVGAMSRTAVPAAPPSTPTPAAINDGPPRNRHERRRQRAMSGRTWPKGIRR